MDYVNVCIYVRGMLKRVVKHPMDLHHRSDSSHRRAVPVQAIRRRYLCSNAPSPT